MPKVLPGEAPAPPPTETTTDRPDPSVQATLPTRNPKTDPIIPQAFTPSQGYRNVAVYKAGLAGKLDISSMRSNQMYGWIDPGVVRQAPHTMAYYTTANQSEANAAAMNDALSWYGTTYGDEAMGLFVKTFLIQDPVSQQRTRDLVGVLADLDPSKYDPMTSGRLDAGDAPGNLETILSNPAHMEEAFARLTPAEQLGVHNLALSLQQSLAGKSDLDVDAFQRTVAVAQNGYHSVMSPADIRAVNELVKIANTGIGGTTVSTQDLSPALAAQAESLGIDQIRRMGGGIIVLDEADAKANPDTALAVQEMLQARFPEASIQIGKQGVIASMIEKLGMPIDYISAPIGAVLHQGTEALQKLTADGDPSTTLKLIGEAQSQIQELGVAPKWVRDAMTAGIDFGDPENPEDVQRFLDHMRDQNTFDIGPDTVWDDLKANTRPEQMGFGLGDTFAKSAGLMPGDPGYEASRIGIGLVANIVLDPLNWAGPVIGGVRAASRVPLVRDAEGALQSLQVTNGWIKQMTYMKLARTPEEFVATKTFINTANKLWDIRQAAKTPDAFATLLVQKGTMDLQRAREFALATSREDMSVALMADALGVHQTQTLDDIFGVIEKRNALVLDSPDAIAQKKFYDSVIEGSDLVKPYDSMPTFRQIRRLQQAAHADEPATAIHRAILRAEDTVKRFPSSMIPRTSRHLRRMVENPDKMRTESIVRMFGEFRNIWTKPGFGGRIVLEDATEFSTFTGIRQAREALATATKAGDLEAVKAAESALASAELNMVSAVNSGLSDLGAAAKLMGISDKRFRALLEPFVAGSLTDDIPGQYRWIKDTWRALVDESPKLSGLAKSDLRDLFNVGVRDRIGSIMTDGTHEVGVLTRHIPGEELPYVVPSLSADMARSIPLPSLEHFRSLATNTGRTMSYWRTLGGSRRAISTTHAWLAKLWQQGNSIWRSWVLGSRLIFGLPARIIGEQQLRMAAFEHDSMVWHPLEWFRSTKWSGEDAWLAAGSPEAALGTMIDNIAPQWKWMGRQVVTIDDGSPFFRSYSNEVAKYFRSPEVARWRFVDGEVQAPEQLLARMRDSGVEGQAWMRHLEATVKPGQEVDEAIQVGAENLVTDMNQMIGTGDGANFVKTALRNGSAERNGEVFFVGTDRFADELAQMVKDGEWHPGKLHLTREGGTVLGADVPHLAGELRDRAFSMFYSRPDLATSRVPLYHQIWETEHANLLKLGYSEERATEVARSVAAERTADMMFQIGAHTSGEMLLRTIMPFFPAYRELGTTWLYRIPQRLGQLQESRFALLGWGLGATVLTRRAALIMDTMEQAGIVKQDAQGQWNIPVPGLGRLLNFATGANTEWKTDISLASIAGILPVPFGLTQTDSDGNPLPWNERLRGTLPTLGGMSVATMAALKTTFPNIIGPVEDWSTMFGSDTSFGPHSLDMIWEAVFNEAPPWVFGRTAASMEAQKQFAITDGMRLAMNEIPAPVWRKDFTPEEEQAYTKAEAEYVSEIASRGMRYSTGIYWFKSIVGSALPFSVSVSDEVKDEYGKTWEFLNRLPGGGSGVLASNVYRAVLAQHPEMAVYAVPKSLDMRDVDDPDDSIRAYMDGIADGTVVPLDDREWALFSAGSVSKTLHYATMARIRRESGETFGERLMNKDARDALDAENAQWDQFMTWSEMNTKELGFKQSLKDLLNTFDRYRTARGDVPLISSSQQTLIDFDRRLNRYDQYFEYNFETSGNYQKKLGDAYEALTAAFPQSDEAQAKGWYFNDVQDGYYRKRDNLYESLATAKDQSLVFSKLRQLADRYNHDFTNPDHEDWGSFPSPELYSWSQKTEKEQRRLQAQWAANPADWLTEFQRDAAGYDIPQGEQEKINKWADYTARLDHQLRVYEEANQISSSSNDHEANKKLMEQLLATRAEKLGITDTIKQFTTPTYLRVGSALDLANHTNDIQIDPDIVPAGHMNSWRYVEHLTKWANQYLKGAEIDPQGDNAKPTQELFAKLVNDARQQDDALDQELTEIGVAVDQTNVYSLYRYLFFDVTFNP